MSPWQCTLTPTLILTLCNSHTISEKFERHIPTSHMNLFRDCACSCFEETLRSCCSKEECVSWKGFSRNFSTRLTEGLTTSLDHLSLARPANFQKGSCAFTITRSASAHSQKKQISYCQCSSIHLLHQLDVDSIYTAFPAG